MLSAQQVEALRADIRRTFYASLLHRLDHRTNDHLQVVANYVVRLQQVYGIPPSTALGMLVGAGMDALADTLGDEAEQVVRDALYALELNGA
jgi:hypothetical protein